MKIITVTNSIDTGPTNEVVCDSISLKVVVTRYYSLGFNYIAVYMSLRFLLSDWAK